MRNEIEASVNQLHTLFEHCADFVFYMENVDGQFIYRYVNPVALEKVFQQQSPINQTLQQHVLVLETLHVIERHYRQALETKEQVVFRDFYLFSNTPTTSETTVIPFGNGEAVLAITKEVDILKTIEEENHFLRTLFQEQMNPILVLNTEYEVIKTNKRFYETFGFQPNILSRNFFDIANLDEEKRVVFFNALANACRGRRTVVRQKLIKVRQETAEFILSFTPILLHERVVAICIQAQEYTRNTALQESLDEASTILKAYQFALNEAANLCMTDAEGVIEYVSPGYEKISQYKKEDLIGQTNGLLNSRQHPKSFYKEMWDTIKAGQPWRGEICNRTRLGTHFWVDTTIVPMYGSDGEIEHFLSICLDITDKRVMMTNLRNIERTFRLITENTNDFIVITNEDGIVLYVSPNHESRLGYEKEELLGQFYLSVLTEESKMVLSTELDVLLENEGESQLELQLCTKSSERVWIEAHITAVEDTERSEVYQFVIIAREITKRKQKEDELRFLAYHDSLTLLPNRRYVTLEFPKLVKQAITSGTALTLLYLDGDNFKRINDLYGHDMGDDFIRNFGQALLESVRDHDIIARIGGDEFIVILSNMSLDDDKRNRQTLQTIERIQNTLRRGWMIGSTHFSPTSSIGVVSYPKNGESINELMGHADEALYVAKRINGKDSYHISEKYFQEDV